MSKTKGQIAAIEAQINAAAIYRKAIWIDRCPEEARSTFEEIKRRFLAGQYASQPRSVVAKAIAAAASAHLGTKPSLDAIERWLKK